MLAIHTKRLDIVSATVAHLCAELDSPSQLQRLLGATIPKGWPPGEYDRPAIEFFRDRLAESPSMEGWLTWYAIERANDGRPSTVVAACGYFGPPDADGSVEIGYSVVEPHRSRGIATELVAALVGHALSFSEVRRVVAQSRDDNVASLKVLDRCGFVLAGSGREAGLLEYARDRTTVK